MQKISAVKNDKTMILIVGNIIPKEIKDKFFDMYGIYVWNVKNLLWLLKEYSEIKNEFILLLTYSIYNLQLENSKPDLFGKQRNENEKDSWKERLKALQPGRKILKNVLGECTGLWSVQESFNDGLYRFHLCCKVKNGVDQDLFNAIKNYFTTKYIVFEFKDYSKQITQKEYIQQRNI